MIKKISIRILPIIGKLSDDGGKDSETNSRNTARERSTVISSDTFSPDSVGRRNPIAATHDVNIQGNIIVRR
jgi:hypothetical protein